MNIFHQHAGDHCKINDKERISSSRQVPKTLEKWSELPQEGFQNNEAVIDTFQFYFSTVAIASSEATG